MRWILTLIILLLPIPAAAQGWIEPPILPRPLPIGQHVERLRTSVTVRITDRVARVEVEEWFRNSGGGLAEGDYIYPLPGEAVFSDFSLFQGEEELRGETMDATRARAIYEAIVRRHRDPALIELTGHGLVRARVFPFGPGETRNVTLRYTQVLDRTGDALRFRYIAGSRRTPATTVRPFPAPADRDGVATTFTIVAERGSRFAEPFSPTHPLRTSREGDRLIVRPVGELHGSFEVFLPFDRPGAGITLATHRVDQEDGYFMLALSPGQVQEAPAPRDIVVVVDVSGSMSGEKMEQARQALHQLLGTLSERDRFRLISFSNRVESHRSDWTGVTRSTVEDARAWVNRLAASGGTNIAGALDETFRIGSEEGRLHLVIFITDGLPTVGETDPDRIAARVEASRGEARIFAFGVGYDLHTYLLERVAVAGRGTVDYVEPGQDVEAAVGALAMRIRHPVLVDLRFGGSPVRLTDLQPSRLPDLYAGQDLVVFGRYESMGRDVTGDVAIAGGRNGRTERFTATAEFPAQAASGAYIPGLWAARKVGELMRTIRVEGATPERVAEVRDLALRYGLLTEYTSYLVQEPGSNVANQRPSPLFAASVAPASVTGEAAVDAAKTASVRREARSLADLAAAESRAGGQGGVGDNVRTVAGRSFRLESGVWMDAAHSGRMGVQVLEPFSQAYFEVLARLPELHSYWSAFESVTVAGSRVSIRVAAGGRSTMTTAEIERLIADFRGR